MKSGFSFLDKEILYELEDAILFLIQTKHNMISVEIQNN